MTGLDDWIPGLAGPGWLGLGAALLLGLRHATDPDHLTAVSTLLLSDERAGARRARLLGLAWGMGHAVTLFALGVPVVLFQRHLPVLVQRGAELVIGLVIVALAIRLLVRWRRGVFHTHPHRHGDLQHAHAHGHEGPHGAHASPDISSAPATLYHSPSGEGSSASHAHLHVERLGRSPLEAFGLGLVHGVGGSAAVGILLVGSIPGRGAGVMALALFACATAVSMALLSWVFGHALTHGVVTRRLKQLVPVLGVASLVFGAWYAVAALLPGAL